MPSTSEHAELLSQLGFIEDEEPSEMRSALLALRKLPEAPVYVLIVDENDDQKVTIVVDDKGSLWVANKIISLSAHGFGSYVDFREKVGRKPDG